MFSSPRSLQGKAQGGRRKSEGETRMSMAFCDPESVRGRREAEVRRRNEDERGLPRSGVRLWKAKGEQMRVSFVKFLISAVRNGRQKGGMRKAETSINDFFVCKVFEFRSPQRKYG